VKILDVFSAILGKGAAPAREVLEYVAEGDTELSPKAREALTQLDQEASPEGIADAVAALPAEITNIVRLKLDPVDRNSSDI